MLFLLGRLLFGGFFATTGLMHFMNLSNMSEYAKSKNVPQPKNVVLLTGLVLFVGGLGVVLGAYVQVSLGMLALFLVAVNLKMHRFWTVKEADGRMTEMLAFMKNSALLGATLMMLMLSSPWVYSLGF